MMWFLLIGGGLFGLIVLFSVVAWIAGSRLPEEHTASRAITLRQSPEAVWAVIEDCERYPEWSPNVTRVERVADDGGSEAWRLHMGRNSFVTRTTVSDPPRRLTRTISDDHGPFSGSWTYEVAPAAGDVEGVAVRLTETGRIKSPIPRFIMRYLVGEDAYLKANLRNLGRKFGEDVQPS